MAAPHSPTEEELMEELAFETRALDAARAARKRSLNEQIARSKAARVELEEGASTGEVGVIVRASSGEAGVLTLADVRGATAGVSEHLGAARLEQAAAVSASSTAVSLPDENEQPELLLAPTHVPEAVKTDDLEKVPEAVELKNPDHSSSSNGTEKTVKSNGSEENGGKDIVQPTAVPINSPPVVTRNSAIALAKEENSSLNVPHAKARALSSKRTAYSVSYPPH